MTLLDTVGHHETTALVVAQPKKPEEPGGRGEDFGKSSPVGLVLLILFFIAVGFLVRSMNKHLRKLPASFDKDAPAAEETPAAPEPAEKPAESKAKPEATSGAS
ncbi:MULTISPECIES: hypothetical protein [unclassified Crossiella]|uniref:hypothetical protein n=1 Tax=unclassified Crossiella TaxID=2620835 RepID=UPI001FFF62B1|nr:MULTISPECIES: hypothetical protein [unclassified Crossiella]MCK2237095.1 hypothetical protein [Crossiella sp. S99.2]MCK2250763.1 hypothetical protein [Crossiella sp. S99.1]